MVRKAEMIIWKEMSVVPFSCEGLYSKKLYLEVVSKALYKSWDRISAGIFSFKFNNLWLFYPAGGRSHSDKYLVQSSIYYVYPCALHEKCITLTTLFMTSWHQQNQLSRLMEVHNLPDDFWNNPKEKMMTITFETPASKIAHAHFKQPVTSPWLTARLHLDPSCLIYYLDCMGLGLKGSNLE